MNDAQNRELVEKLTKQLTAEGRIIEAGFQSLRLMAMAPDAPANQVTEMRMAFFAGAQHLLGSIMAMMDPDAEPTENDLRRMTAIDAELKRFIESYKRRHRL